MLFRRTNAVALVNNVDIEITYTGNGVIVHVMKNVLEKWNKHRQNDTIKPEACGIIIGYSDMDNMRVWICDISEPGEKDIRKRTYFKIRDAIHLMLLKKHYTQTNGQLNFIGTWHSHPEDSPIPSYDDKDGWDKNIAVNPSLPVFVFAIIGTKTDFIGIKHNGQYTQLEKLSND